MYTELKSQLYDELASESINVLRIRTICRENPGIIATAGLRLKIWTLLLIGDLSLSNAMTDVEIPQDPCAEQHVLEADIKRTRADVEEFRSTSWRNAVQSILQTFCLTKGIQYKQGMNEVLAPFVFIHPPDNKSSGGSSLSYALFEAFIFRYLERYFCLDDSSFLFKSFRLLNVLLTYFDPQLALHLEDQAFPPELYSPQWFLTLYSRALPIPQVLRLWDMLITIDDPSFTFFIGLCLLRRKRDELLLSDTDRLPEILMGIHFNGEEEIDSIVTEALQLYKNTPRCFLRNLRLCCVSSSALTPQPNHSNQPAQSSKSHHMDLILTDQDKFVTMQSVRSCLMLSAQELVGSLSPLNHHDGSPFSSQLPSPKNGQSTSTAMIIPQQYVIIDVRPYEDSIVTGAGSIPRAIQLEPDFLNHPDALDIWIQHFDGTRGCNICIIDLPPTQVSGLALWRRLLLGEGDGVSNSSVVSIDDSKPSDFGRGITSIFSNILSPKVELKSTHASQNERELDEVGASSTHSPSILSGANEGLSSSSHSLQVKQFKQEIETIKAMDAKRPALILASILQRNSFPNVSVLDGGFPMLVEQLEASRGTVEPIIINHYDDKWKQFLKSTGREYNTIQNARNQLRLAVKNAYQDDQLLQSDEKPRKVSDLTEVEKYSMALEVAKRLGHNNMIEILTYRLNLLEIIMTDP